MRSYVGTHDQFQRDWAANEDNTTAPEAEGAAALEDDIDVFDHSGINTACGVESDIPAPMSSDPADWENYLTYYQCNLSPAMIRFALQIQQSITKTRDGTVAQFAKSAMFINRPE